MQAVATVSPSSSPPHCLLLLLAIVAHSFFFPTGAQQHHLCFLLEQRTHASALTVAAHSFFPISAQQHHLCFLLSQHTHTSVVAVTTPIYHLQPHPNCHHSPILYRAHYTKYDVTNAMAMDDVLDARVKAFETRIEDILQELFREFRRSRSKKYDYGQHIGYPHMREEFPRWEDGNPIGWISCVEKVFHFHKTPEESMVEISSTQLKDDVIQWYDLYETYHGVPSWGQFKRELLIHFRPSEYKNINGQLTKIRQISTVQEY
ncbi:hypothetical protein BHE74_00058380 [Ensete ventricosum]|nr:hypothetical protein BHE74_00058380 [Ensete ventricosum]